jgi:hypothetical protein
MLKNFSKKVRAAIKYSPLDPNKHLPFPIKYPFMMTAEEKNLFENTVKDSAFYLEFGSGGSTIRTLLKTKAKVVSVESHMDWLKVMRAYYFIRRMEKKNRLILYHANIGQTGAGGKPVNDDEKHLFPVYSAKIFNLITEKEIAEIDTVFVDGRFRVACVLNTILQCHANKRLAIMIHDFEREKYHILLKYLTVNKSADSLFLFKIKDDIDFKQVGLDYEQFKFLPSV